MNRVGDRTIGPFLLVAFQTRYKEVLIKAHTAAPAVAPKHLSLLTNEETKCEINSYFLYYLYIRLSFFFFLDSLMKILWLTFEVYEAGQSSTAAFKKWRMGGPRLQKASILGRKRKPLE